MRRLRSWIPWPALLATSVLLAQPSDAAPASGARRAVRVAAEAAPQLAGLALAPRARHDYGAFVWLELSEGDYRTLRTSGLPFQDSQGSGQVQVTRFRFDPVLEGEPPLPAHLTGGAGPRGGLRLVQLAAPATEDRQAALRAAGVAPLQYYPTDTYLAWTDAAGATALDGLDFVRWHGDFHPGYKISPDLDDLSGEIRNVSFFFYDDGAIEATLDEIRRLGGTILRHHPAQPDGVFQTAVARLDRGAVDQAARIPAVVWLGYRSPQIQLDDEMSDQIVAGNHPGGVPEVGFEAHLSSLGVDGSGVTWAIVDTGVDFDHPELGGRIVGGWSGAGACAPAGGDCASGGHGTHVAGIALGDGSTGVIDDDGFLCGLGMAPAGSIFAMNIFFGNDPLQEFSKQAVLGGAIGSNNSWTTGEGTCHGYQDSERTYDIMVRDGNFDTPGVAEPHIVVFSAGNSGPGNCTLTAPKEAKNIIVTAGTQNFRTTGNIEAMYNSSSRGPAVDGRLGPTIATPGQTIFSTKNDLGGSCGVTVCGSALHSTCSGTSMASPHASGAVVLLAEWWRAGHSGADPSPAMAKALLVNTGVDISSTPAIPNKDEGWGRVDITSLVAPTVATEYFDQTVILEGTGQQWTRVVEIASAGAPLKVSLAWSDAPGAVGANPALVNDLDLEVEIDGTTYRGNAFSGGWSAPGGAADALNNAENVFIQSPTGATAKVRVIGSAVNGDGVPFVGDGTDQDFALLCSNCVDTTLFVDGFESGDTSSWSSSVP